MSFGRRSVVSSIAILQPLVIASLLTSRSRDCMLPRWTMHFKIDQDLLENTPFHTHNICSFTGSTAYHSDRHHCFLWGTTSNVRTLTYSYRVTHVQRGVLNMLRSEQLGNGSTNFVRIPSELDDTYIGLREGGGPTWPECTPAGRP